MAPSVVGGDSGELTASALTGGVPHPPGYPLFCVLARLFNLLPFGPSPAWRVNLLSAVATAGAGAMVCATVQAWTRQTAAGLAAGAMFGANEVVWRHATSAEVAVSGHPGMPRLDTQASLWKHLAIGYQVLSQQDQAYTKRAVMACEKFLARAEPGDSYIAAVRGQIDRFRSQSGAGL